VKRGRLLLMASLGLAGTAALAAVTVCLTAGCGTLGYYAQSASGHVALLSSARPVPEWLSDEGSGMALKERLALSQRIRDYAVTELKLPDNASYRRYADLKRGAAVWNVVAAPELSLTLKTWCFPVVGCVGYRGYFNRADADAFATELRAQGLEVSVYGVPAYSTLGLLPGDFFADPLLSTFVNYPEGELARLIFHELAHQVAYAKDDTVFNESFATAVERIGGGRWLAERAGAQAREDYARFDGRRQDFRALTQRFRDALDALYRSDATDADKRASKQALLARLREDYAALKAQRWGGFSGYDGWFERANNASFGVLSAYNELVPQFEKLFEREGRDFSRFYAAVRRLATSPKPDRQAALDMTP
jgi:predicted aminopeptidase